MMTAKNIETIIREIESPMYRMAMFFTKDRATSRDIVQEALLRIWKNRKKLGEIENIKGWALRITKNLCIDQSRKKKNYLAPIEDGLHVASEQLRPDQNVSMMDQMTLVQQALEELNPLQKMAIELREVEGFTYKEIADIMEENINQVKILIYRGRQNIKEFIMKKNEYGIQ